MPFSIRAKSIWSSPPDISSRIMKNWITIIDRYEPAGHFPFDRIQGRTTIFISLGTVFNHDEAFYRMCIEALSSFDGQVVLSVGNRQDVRMFQGIPDHFIVRSYVPQLEVLRHTDLFVTHGGMNSVNEALYFGIPLIVVPMAADQPLVGERVSELGAGIKLRREQLTPELLRESVDNVLRADDYRRNSMKIGDSLRSAGGQKKAAEEIRRFKQTYLP